MAKKKIHRTVVGVLVNLVVAVALLGSSLFVVAGLFGLERYVIMTGSMTGTYDVGSIVFDKKTPADELKVGDAITYQPPASAGVPHLVTHRITSIRHPKVGPAEFRTKGDANPQVDPWKFHLESSVQPRVAFSVPYAGYVFIALADRQIRMLVIGAPAALLALYSLAEIASALRSKRPTTAPPSGATATPSTP